MIKAIVLSAMLLISAGPVIAGSCQDHIKINEIANIQTDGGDVLVRSNNFKLGSGFGWTVPGNSTFRLSASQPAEFKKNSLAALLSAKASAEIVYLQVSFVSSYVFQIEKVALGPSAFGLECASYP